jgi:hypothetical protein
VVVTRTMYTRIRVGYLLYYNLSFVGRPVVLELTKTRSLPVRTVSNALIDQSPGR